MKKLIIISLTVALTAFAFSCSDKDVTSDLEKGDNRIEDSAVEQQPENETDVTAPAVGEPQLPEEPPPAQQDTSSRSILTGMPCSEDELYTRPIAVMINNNKVSLPQMGISNADIIYECDAEGGMTRMMALFSNWQMIPEIGSVRSARDYFVTLSHCHDAIFVHAGGSPSAYTRIAELDTDNIDGVNMNYLPSKTFYRDSDRIVNNGYEHSMMTGGSKIYRASNVLEYGSNHRDGFKSYAFKRSSTPIDGAIDATMLSLKHSSYITVDFEYDNKNKVWLKSSFGSPHVDGENGEQLKFENVIVLFVSQEVVDDEGRLDIDITSGGKGYYFTEGGYTEIQWKASTDGAPFSFTVSGEELLLNPGKTHITLFNKSHTNDVKIS